MREFVERAPAFRRRLATSRCTTFEASETLHDGSECSREVRAVLDLVVAPLAEPLTRTPWVSSRQLSPGPQPPSQVREKPSAAAIPLRISAPIPVATSGPKPITMVRIPRSRRSLMAATGPSLSTHPRVQAGAPSGPQFPSNREHSQAIGSTQVFDFPDCSWEDHRSPAGRNRPGRCPGAARIRARPRPGSRWWVSRLRLRCWRAAPSPLRQRSPAHSTARSRA